MLILLYVQELGCDKIMGRVLPGQKLLRKELSSLCPKRIGRGREKGGRGKENVA